jgi:hypothetical protein
MALGFVSQIHKKLIEGWIMDNGKPGAAPSLGEDWHRWLPGKDNPSSYQVVYDDAKDSNRIPES